MSYGWLTESTLIPQKSKNIPVDSTSLLELQLQIQKQKPESKGLQKARDTKSFQQKEFMKQKDVFNRKNQGLEQRIEKSDTIKPKSEKVVSKLQQKQLIYKNLQEKGNNISQLLVDFEQKKYDNQTVQEKEQYERERERFYQEKKQELKEQEEHILGGQTQLSNQGLNKIFNQQERERLLWEKEVLQQLEENLSDDAIQDKKNEVKQVYDNFLSKNEKQALEKVIIESNQEVEEINEIKRKTQQFQEIRLQKLRKLNYQQ